MTYVGSVKVDLDLPKIKRCAPTVLTKLAKRLCARFLCRPNTNEFGPHLIFGAIFQAGQLPVCQKIINKFRSLAVGNHFNIDTDCTSSADGDGKSLPGLREVKCDFRQL